MAMSLPPVVGKGIIRNIRELGSKGPKNAMKLGKVLLLQKLSRLDMERLRHPHLSDKELKEAITQRGTDYTTMLKHHDINTQFQVRALEAFEKSGIATKIVNRFNYTEEALDWCDVVMTLGGDGTFLLAANKIQDNQKPLIGLNSDPCRSEGHLCLPKQYSSKIQSAINKILSGRFRLMFRSRIRVTIKGGNCNEMPRELHHQALPSQLRDLGEKESKSALSGQSRVLPVLALNEVFLGENMSAKVSYFEVKVNESEETTRVKSSGLLACTGTGSTSWNLSTNRLNNQDVRELLRVYTENTKTGPLDESLVPIVCDQFNSRFIYPPEDPRIGYTIRDMIYAGVWPKPKDRLPARGLVKKIEVKSRCTDAGLVIDGGVLIPFNDGTTATLETNHSTALRTVVLL